MPICTQNRRPVPYPLSLSLILIPYPYPLSLSLIPYPLSLSLVLIPCPYPLSLIPYALFLAFPEVFLTSRWRCTQNRRRAGLACQACFVVLYAPRRMKCPYFVVLYAPRPMKCPYFVVLYAPLSLSLIHRLTYPLSLCTFPSFS